MSTRVLKALPGKLDIKTHSPSIFYLQCTPRRILKSENLTYKITNMLCNKNGISIMCTFLYSRAVIVGLPQQNSKLGNGDTAGNFRSNFEAPLYKKKKEWHGHLVKFQIGLT